MTAENTIVIRSDAWVGVFPLFVADGIRRLKSHCEGARQSDEAIGDAWLIEPEGEPVRLQIKSTMTPYDENDRATITVWFIDIRRTTVDPDVMAAVHFAVDGRS